MKWFIASDLHGSAHFCDRMVEAYKREQADRLVLLGDILYHGPRNDLPEGYAPKAVIAALNPLRDEILCVRGNCDTEVDQMVLEFPVLADYAVIADGDLTVYLTHGHKYGEQNPLPMPRGSILLCGHTHIPACNAHEGFIYMNPGSVSIPKNGSCHGYMTLENGVFTWKDLEGNVISSYTAE
ncbi:MAG: phosphodiesterase [Clostridia bacterium]|nr:phosphodiesterase [Clostridia bacterium]